MSDQPHSAAVAAEDVTYGWAPGRLFAGQLTVGLISVIIVTGLFLLIDFASGRALRPDDPWLVTFMAPYALTFPVAFASSALLVTRRRPPWLRISAAGVELAASRIDPVFIPWLAVSSARLRWWWPLTLLKITVSDSAAVVMRQRGGRRPKQRYRAGRETFVMDVGALRAKRETIRTELARRGCPVA